MTIRPRKGNRLTDMVYDEVSHVRRPANQLSKVVLFKSDVDGDDEPVVTVSNQSGTTTKETPMTKSKDDQTVTIDKSALPSEVVAYIDALENDNSELAKALDEATELLESVDLTPVPDPIGKSAEELIKSADPLVQEAFAALQKSADDAKAEAAKAQEIAKKEHEVRVTGEYIAKAATDYPDLGVDNTKLGMILKGVAESLGDAPLQDLQQILSAANAQVAKGEALFTEIGKTAQLTSVTDSLEAKATSVAKSDPSLTKEQAMAKALDEDPALYTEYLKNKGA